RAMTFHFLFPALPVSPVVVTVHAIANRSRSNHKLAAVDFNRLAVNITRGVGGQEGDHSAAFFRSSQAAHRNGLDELLQQFWRGHPFVEWRVNHSGRYAVDANAMWRKLLGQSFRQTHHARFGRRVNSRPWTASVMPRNRAYVDDHPVAAIRHFRRYGLRAEQHAFKIEVHQPIPQLFTEFKQRASLNQIARVVDQNICRSEAPARGFDQRLRAAPGRHVGLNDYGAPALRFDESLCLFRPGLILIVVDRHRRAALGQRYCRPPSDARARAGDNCDATVQILFVHILFLLESIPLAVASVVSLYIEVLRGMEALVCRLLPETLVIPPPYILVELAAWKQKFAVCAIWKHKLAESSV